MSRQSNFLRLLYFNVGVIVNFYNTRWSASKL